MSPTFLPLLMPLIESVMGPERKRTNELRSKLVTTNHGYGGSEYGFYFMGERYSHHSATALYGKVLREVEPQLKDEVQWLLDEKEKAKRDEQKLRQALSVVLPKCKTRQDVRDVLPEVFIRDVHELRRLSRINEEGFLLAQFPTLRSQYQKAVDIAEYYSANKFLY